MADYDDPFRATFYALVQRARGTSGSKLTDADRCDGVALVTGANRGLGEAIAVGLAERGAEVILAGRTPAAHARRTIRERGGEARCEHVDLADLRSVRELAERVSDRPIRALVLNAGVVPPRSRATAQGFEIQNGVNYLANVLLVDELVRRGALGEGSRVVTVSSESHRSSAPMDLSALGHADEYGMRGVLERYSYSKMLLTTWSVHMAKELEGEGIAFHSMCPGPVRTDIAREAPKLGQLVLAPIMRVFFVDPKIGAEPVVYLACARDLEGRTGLYYHRWEEKPPHERCLDPENGRALTEESRRLIERALAPSAG
ncbi:MAG: SDR family NAD(P)-dependent oxidoreductase [Sandaracinaceae bacterium]